MGFRTPTRAAARRAAALAALASAGALAGCADMGGAHPLPTSTLSARCSDQHFPIYFTHGSAELLPDSLAVIRTGARRVTGCHIATVEVVGVAVPDAPGRPADPALTQRRADAVAQALQQAGLPAPSFDVQAAGAPPHAGVHAPLARRTEVIVHAGPA